MNWSYTWRWGALSTFVARLTAATAAAYLVQALLPRGAASAAYRWLALSGVGIRSGALWQFATYLFLHAGVAHLVMNLVGLALIGPAAEHALGRRHFLAVYLISGLLGGLGFVLIQPDLPCVGASGAVFGVFGAFVAWFPRQPMTLLFLPFFSIEARWMALLFGGLELAYLVAGTGGGVAYAAHVAGGVAGYLYARMVRRASVTGSPWPTWPGFRRGAPRASGPAGAGGSAAGEVDAVLDKIAQRGLRSLNARERRLLDEASRERRGEGR